MAEIFQALRDVSVASRSNKPIGDRMIAERCLSRRPRDGAGIRRAGQGHRSALREADVQATGPSLPHNFVNIRLKLERAH